MAVERFEAGKLYVACHPEQLRILVLECLETKSTVDGLASKCVTLTPTGNRVVKRLWHEDWDEL